MDVFDFDETFGDDYLHFYLPMLTPERNEADAAEIVRILDLASGQRVLAAPCGHGRISNLLARSGIAVVGIDRSELFLDVARRDAADLGVEVDYRLAELTALTYTAPDQFDAAINWFTSFGYHDDATLRTMLAAYRNVLRPGGQLLIETLHHDWFVRHHVEPRHATVTAVGDDVMYDLTTFDPGSGRIETVRTIHRQGQRRVSQHFVRLPTSPEWKSWLSHAGFRNVRITGRNMSDLTVDSRRMVIIAST